MKPYLKECLVGKLWEVRDPPMRQTVFNIDFIEYACSSLSMAIILHFLMLIKTNDHTNTTTSTALYVMNALYIYMKYKWNMK